MRWGCAWRVRGFAAVIALTLSRLERPGWSQHSSAQYSTAQHSTAQRSTVQYSTVQYRAAQCIAVQYSAVQYSTAQHSTAQHSTVLFGLAAGPLHTHTHSSAPQGLLSILQPAAQHTHTHTPHPLAYPPGAACGLIGHGWQASSYEGIL